AGALSDIAANKINDICADFQSTDFGQTTVVVAIINCDGVYTVSCGDSQSWLYRNAFMKGNCLTKSQISYRVGQGAIPVINRVDATHGKIVIGSDGLWDYCTEEHVAQAIYEK